MDVITLSPMEQKKLQKIQMIALLEINRLCKKHNLRYFLAFGTLLGAVRHQGFIPWDDDIDITMPRDDMLRFVSICKDELDSAFFIQTPETDLEYSLPIFRLRVNGTKCVELDFKDVNIHNGIFVDIYPCDNIPNSRIKQIIYKYISKYLITSVNILSGVYVQHLPLFKKIVAYTLSSPLRFLNKFTRIKLRDGYLSQYNKHDTKYVVVQDGNGLVWKYIYPHKFIDTVELLNFEGLNLPCSKLYKNMLSQMYGDYMVLPPVEKRRQHHGFLQLEFGKYESDEYVDAILKKYKEI